LRNRAVQIVATLLLAACSRVPEEQHFARHEASAIDHGERLTKVLGCQGCHGKDLTGTDWSEPSFVEMRTANLTISASRYSPFQLGNMIRLGKRSGGRELWEMPSNLFTQLNPDDLNAVVAYLKTLKQTGEAAPDPLFLAAARSEIAAGTFESSAAAVRKDANNPGPDAGADHALGRYIVRATCAECHGIDLRGARAFSGATAPPDLRIVAAYGESDFMTFMLTGKAAGGRELPMMSGVARGRFAHFTDAERKSVYRYLKALGESESGTR
jgi:cytochrome c553